MSDEKKPEPFNFDQILPTMKKTMYMVEFVVLGRSVRSPIATVTLSSLSTMCAVFLASNYPQVSGFTIWNADGTEILEVVDAFGFTAHFSPTIQKVVGAQVLRSGIPVIQAGKEGVDLQKLMEEGRKAGRVTQNQKFDPDTKKEEPKLPAAPTPEVKPDPKAGEKPKTGENPAA